MNIELAGVEVADLPSVREILESRPSDCGLASFLSSLRGELLRCGFMMGEVLVDGNRLPAEDEASLEGVLIDQIGHVRVDVVPTTTFVGETFAECVRATSCLEQLAGDITSAVRSGQVSEASDDLARFTDGLAVLATAYRDGLELLARVDLATAEDVDCCRQTMGALGDVLREVLEGITQEDFVIVSDALEYEFPKRLGILSSEFSRWSTRLGSVVAGSVVAGSAEVENTWAREIESEN